jgi:V/A-type H+-transporting ATPase subunit E
VAGNKIIEKIEEEARQGAAAITAAAKEKADAETSRILDKAKTSVEEIKAKSVVDAQEAAGRLVLIAELKSRKDSLASQRKVIQEAFDKASDQLAHLPREKWEKLIMQLITTSDVDGTETLVVPQKDREAYESGFLSRINEALKAQGKKGEMVLSPNPASFTDGILIQGKDCDYDGSFATLLGDVRSEEEYRVAGILFGAEVK